MFASKAVIVICICLKHSYKSDYRDLYLLSFSNMQSCVVFVNRSLSGNRIATGWRIVLNSSVCCCWLPSPLHIFLLQVCSNYCSGGSTVGRGGGVGQDYMDEMIAEK